jgi:protoheme IX farnesyltransferase
VLFVWQIPHFIAITLFRAEEYARAGLKVDVVVRGVDAARWRIIGWSVVQFAASLFVIKSGVGGRFYEGAAFSLGAVLLALCGYALRPMSDEKTQRWARWFFLYSLVYLPVLFTTLVIGR